MEYLAEQQTTCLAAAAAHVSGVVVTAGCLPVSGWLQTASLAICGWDLQCVLLK